MATVGLDLSTTLKTRRPLVRVRSRKLIFGSFVCALLATDAATINAKIANFRTKGRRISSYLFRRSSSYPFTLLPFLPFVLCCLNPNPADCDKPCPCPFPHASLLPETSLPASGLDPCESSAPAQISVRASV